MRYGHIWPTNGVHGSPLRVETHANMINARTLWRVATDWVIVTRRQRNQPCIPQFAFQRQPILSRAVTSFYGTHGSFHRHQDSIVPELPEVCIDFRSSLECDAIRFGTTQHIHGFVMAARLPNQRSK